MTWVTGIVVYLMIWWLTLFTVLPWGNEPERAPETGNAPSAPARPRLGLKFLITTAIAAMIWVAVFLLIRAAPVDFYQAAEEMMKGSRP